MTKHSTLRISELLWGSTPLRYWERTSLEDVETILGEATATGENEFSFGHMDCVVDDVGMITRCVIELRKKDGIVRLGKRSLLFDIVYRDMTIADLAGVMIENNVPFLTYVQKDGAADSDLVVVTNRYAAVRFWGSSPGKYEANNVVLYSDEYECMKRFFNVKRPQFNAITSLNDGLTRF